MTERRLIDELIAGSSLGTPDARRSRSQTPDEVVRKLRRRLQELEGQGHPDRRPASRVKVSVVRSPADLQEAGSEGKAPVPTEGVRLSAPSVRWRKSSGSGVAACVEVAFLGDQVAVRDSKNRGGPVLLFTAPEWEAFIAGVRVGEFDALERESSRTEGQVAVQHSENQHGPALLFSGTEWGAFLGGVRNGEFDPPE
jgi:hypothetical protein